MAKSLVIVEPLAKARTINRYLGDEFIVKSSVGHVRDLPVGGSSRSTPAQRAKEAAYTRSLPPEERAEHRKRKAKEQLIRRMGVDPENGWEAQDRKSTRLNSSHVSISYAVFCLKKKIYNI